jgi:N-acetylmuramoyl-L-alanine amidase
MRCIALFMILLLFWLSPAVAAVSVGLKGGQLTRIEDVYQLDDTVYISLDDVLSSVGLSGSWDSVKHSYKIKSKKGDAEVSPGMRYLKIGDNFYPLDEEPRFIDGRLRVTDDFVHDQLPLLTSAPIAYQNLDPNLSQTQVKKQTRLDSLFSFLLNRKDEPAEQGPAIRAIAIDPGHGGSDAGVIGDNGVKEKQIVLDYAEALARQIKMKLGIPVYLSRDGDYQLTVEKRLQSAGQDDVDIWIRLHAQGSFSAADQGITFFVRPDTQKQNQTEEKPPSSLLLAETLATAVAEDHFLVQGIYQSSRLSLGRGDLPTVQIELGYLTNAEDLEHLQDKLYQQQLIASLYRGIEHYAALVKESKDGEH